MCCQNEDAVRQIMMHNHIVGFYLPPKGNPPPGKFPPAPCWNCLIMFWSPPMPPICWRTRGSIILATCWLSLAIWAGFTFLLMSPPEERRQERERKRERERERVRVRVKEGWTEEARERWNVNTNKINVLIHVHVSGHQTQVHWRGNFSKQYGNGHHTWRLLYADKHAHTHTHTPN